MRYLNTCILTCYWAPMIWVLAPQGSSLHADPGPQHAPAFQRLDHVAVVARTVIAVAGVYQVALHRGLRAAEDAYAAGTRDANTLRQLIEAPIRQTKGVIDYVSIADPDTLAELEVIGARGAVVSLAVRFGTTRLLDNVILG